jgi:hypothetical protein
LTPLSKLSSCTLRPKERRRKRKCNIICVIVFCVHLFLYIILYSFIQCVKPNKCIRVFIFTSIMFKIRRMSFTQFGTYTYMSKIIYTHLLNINVKYTLVYV